MQGGLRSRFAFLLAAGGLGLCGYAALQWQQLPRYSEDDLKASAELNLRLDLARRGVQTLPPPEEMERLRQQEFDEIQQELKNQHETVMTWLAVGLALLVIAMSQWLMTKLLLQRSNTGSDR